MSTTKKKFIPVKPPKLTPEVHRRVVALMQAGNFKGTAAAAVRVHVNTINNWLNKGLDITDESGNITKPAPKLYREFRLDFEAATALHEASTLASIDKVDDWKAKAWILARRHKAWSGKTTVEHTGPQGGTLAPPQMFLTIEGQQTQPWIYDDNAGHEADPGDEDESHP